MNFDTKFWLKVWPRGDCWEWRGNMSDKGYGRFRDGDEQPRAHRYAYERAFGVLHATDLLDHRCNHRWCVRPSHLVVATIRENTLRGNNQTAINARKTHCKHGHEFSLENTYIGHTPSGPRRDCRMCKQLRDKGRKHRPRVRAFGERPGEPE